MWVVGSDMRADAPIFDACPIYSASQCTDLRSTTSRHGRRDSPRMYRKIGRTVAAAIIATIASAAFASTANAGPADRVGRKLRRRAHHPAVPALRRPGQLQAAPGRLVRGRHGAWQLSGGAKIVSGNETYKVGGSTHSRSLQLPERQRRGLAVHLRRALGADPAPVRQAQQRAPGARLHAQRPDPGEDQPRALGLAPGPPGRPRRQLLASDGIDAADREHPAAVAAATRRPSASGSRRCSAAGRSTTSTSIRTGCARRA